MTTILTWLWGSDYRPAHVQRLAASVARWTSGPHRFLCVTDQQVPGVPTMRDPAGSAYPRCARRLWLFSEAAAEAIPGGVLHLDLDVVVCGPLDPLFDRADFAIYRAASIAARGYSLNPSVQWLRTGTQTDIWRQFKKDPHRVIARAKADGFWGSDQAVISHHYRKRAVETFGDEDGVVSFRRIRSERLTDPPDGTRIVSFHGRRTPWEPEVQAEHPWIGRAWQEAVA